MVATYTEGDEPVPGFRLVQRLGWGRFGEVWKATTPGGFEAAIKFISLNNNHGLKEFRAIRLFKQLRHPNLVPLIALWLKDKQGTFIDDAVVDDPSMLQDQAAELIIAMGVGDKSLFDRLHECQEKDGLPGIPAAELLDYMEQVAGALDFLNQSVHDFGMGPVAIQHCDIKPHNILLVSGAAQVCDLGVARVLEDQRATAAMGSAAYVAPECVSEGRPSLATDQYSLAITYFELRTGTLPFEVKSIAAAYMAHMQGKLDLARLPRAEQDVIRRATAVRPDERFPSIRAMVRALRQAAEPCLDEPLPPLPPRRLAQVHEADPRKTAGLRMRASEPEIMLTDTSFPLPFSQPVPPQAAPPLPSASLSDEGRTSAIRPWPSAPPEAPRLQRKSAPPTRNKWLVGAIVALLAFLLPAVALPGRVLFSNPVTTNEQQSEKTEAPVEPPPVVPLAQQAPVASAAPREPVSQDPPQPPAPSSPVTADAQLEQARQRMSQGDYANAVTACSEALRLKAAGPEAYLLRAAARTELGQYDAAIADYGEAIRLDDRDPGPYLARAQVESQKGDADRAIADATEALDRNPKLAEAYFTRASAWCARREFANALKDYDEAIHLRPREPRYHHEKTHAYLAQGKLDLAVVHYTEMLTQDPGNAIAYAERGHAEFHRGRYEQTVRDCTRAISLNPRYTEAYCQRAEAYRLLRRYNEAVADCGAALRLDSRCALAHFYRGKIYYDWGGHYDEAIADYTRALELNPRFTEAYLRRHEAWNCKGNEQQAAADWEAWKRTGETPNLVQ